MYKLVPLLLPHANRKTASKPPNARTRGFTGRRSLPAGPSLPFMPGAAMIGSAFNHSKGDCKPGESKCIPDLSSCLNRKTTRSWVCLVECKPLSHSHIHRHVCRCCQALYATRVSMSASCQVCGKPVASPVTCPGCGAMYYCSYKHLIAHRHKLGHDAECGRMAAQVARRQASCADGPGACCMALWACSRCNHCAGKSFIG
jgi:hypothetical protein